MLHMVTKIMLRCNIFRMLFIQNNTRH